MKIAHLIHGLGLGGAQQVIRFIVQERDAEEFEHVVYTCHGGVFREPIEQAGGRVRILPRRIPKFDPLWIRAMARAMREDRIDVVHGHLFGDTLHGYFACSKAGLLPMVMTLHNSTDARTRLQLMGYRWLLRQQTVAIACADFVRTSFIEHAGDMARGIRAIANGISVNPATLDRSTAGKILGLRDGAVVLATIGRMAEQKAYDHLLYSLSELPDEVADYQVVMFGDGPLRGDLEALCRQLGLEDRILFAGFRDDVTELLGSLDGVVFSSLFEGLPIAMLEAMAAGRAVVATAVGGIPGAVEADREALLVPSGDRAALTAALARVISDQGLRQRLGDAARQRFEGEFTARRMTERYQDLYREVVADRAASESAGAA